MIELLNNLVVWLAARVAELAANSIVTGQDHTAEIASIQAAAAFLSSLAGIFA